MDCIRLAANADEDKAMLDNFSVGEIVKARFTNSQRVHEFKGKVVGKTKNYWKVESLEPVYQGEPAGRVFHIVTVRDRRYSENNRIMYKLEL